MGKTQSVQKLEAQQKTLKREIKKIKKRTPYVGIGIILCVFVIIFSVQKWTNYSFKNNSNLFLFSGSTIAFLSLAYFAFMNQKIKKNERKIKIIGNQLYNLMKLDA